MYSALVAPRRSRRPINNPRYVIRRTAFFIFPIYWACGRISASAASSRRIPMTKFITFSAVASTLLGLCLAAPAQATGINRAWVSGHGTDAAGCGAPTNPCRSLQYVISNIIAAAGEIDILDPSGYGAVTIPFALSIVNDGVGTAGVQEATSGANAITINAGASDVIYLRGLTIEGLGTGANGIVFNSGARLTVTNSVIRHFATNGVSLFSTGATSFSISNTIAGDNGTNGIYIAPHNSGSIQGTITDVETNGNGYIGIGLDGQFSTGTASTVTIVRSVTAYNNFAGISVQSGFMSAVVNDTNSSNNNFGGFVTTGGGVLRLTRCVATGNSQGASSVGVIYTYGDNRIVGNGLDINATMTSLTGN
jgi:hypothetical protein